jgi:hypothetical protein
MIVRKLNALGGDDRISPFMTCSHRLLRAQLKVGSRCMKSAFRLLAAAMFCAPLHAQTPPPAPPANQYPAAQAGPVPINEEPRHRLVLQNDFTHVYNVMVPPLDATLLHQHDLPYLYVTLGQADIVNAVVGKPEVRLTLQDGETHYSPAPFAHLVRTDSGLPFHNITVELVHPQTNPRNLCKDVAPGLPDDCPAPAPLPAASDKKKASGDDTKKGTAAESPADATPYFETDEVRVELFKVSEGRDYVDSAPKVHALAIALTDANLDAYLAGEHVSFLHVGDVLWMPAGQPRRIVDFLGTRSSFLLISFKDGAPPASH